ncbi:unnamed protein product [Malus baccata var. baccata]
MPLVTFSNGRKSTTANKLNVRSHIILPRIKSFAPATFWRFVWIQILFISLCLCLCSTTQGYKFYVGGRDGWVLNPSENYNHWAERNRFNVNDNLFFFFFSFYPPYILGQILFLIFASSCHVHTYTDFKYQKGSDSVLVVNKDDYFNCNTQNPIQKLDGGDSDFTFDRSGPFYFISGQNGNCAKGQKFLIIVLAPRHSKRPVLPPPPTSPTTPTAPGPSPTAPTAPTYPPATSPQQPYQPPAASPPQGPGLPPAAGPVSPSPSPVITNPPPSASPGPWSSQPSPSPSTSPVPAAGPFSPSPSPVITNPPPAASPGPWSSQPSPSPSTYPGPAPSTTTSPVPAPSSGYTPSTSPPSPPPEGLAPTPSGVPEGPTPTPSDQPAGPTPPGTVTSPPPGSEESTAQKPSNNGALRGVTAPSSVLVSLAVVLVSVALS